MKKSKLTKKDLELRIITLQERYQHLQERCQELQMDIDTLRQTKMSWDTYDEAFKSIHERLSAIGSDGRYLLSACRELRSDLDHTRHFLGHPIFKVFWRL